MQKIVTKPQYFFFTLSILAIISACIVSENGFFVNIFSVYLVIPFKSASILASIFFLLICINYFAISWVNKKANSILTIIHIILQVLAIILIIYGGFEQTTNDYNQNYFQNSSIITFTFLGILVFILSIFIHLVNFFTSLFSKRD